MKLLASRNFLLIALCFSLLFSPATASAQPQQEKDSRGPDPVVDFDKPQPDSRPANVRQPRSRSHNLPEGRVLREPKPGQEEEQGISDAFERLPALPVSQSDLIVIGSVVKATAFLSEDKHFVYSEFEVLVRSVLKNSGTTSIAIGSRIDAERPGGAVRFPSGRTWHYRVFKQGFPRLGSEYFLFLRERPATSDYHLITGYRLENGKVMPLDGVGYDFNPPLAFAKYKGADEVSFMNDLRDAINGGGPR